MKILIGEKNLNLLNKKILFRTSDDDPLDYYYTWYTKYFYLKRLKMAKKMLEGENYDCLLEIGYGSGIFLPELSLRCRRLEGIDIHSHHSVIMNNLRRVGINAILRSGDICSLPYSDNFFDCVVCLSVLEHLNEENLNFAISEVKRVLRFGGTLITGVPMDAYPLKVFFSLVKFDFLHKHLSNFRTILNLLDRDLNREKIIWWPLFLPLKWGFYLVAKHKK